MFVRYDVEVHLVKMHVFRILDSCENNNGKIMQSTQQETTKSFITSTSFDSVGFKVIFCIWY